MTPITIHKAGGEAEPFSKEKFVHSLTKAGATPSAIDSILTHINRELHEGVTTHHLYSLAFRLLHKMEKPASIQYSLRRALEDLGPSGFPFESFLQELFRVRGFETAIRQILPGRCVPHELDVIAWNENKLLMVESKFHNQQGMKTDIKTALYVKARFDDLSEQLFDFGGKSRSLDEGWLVTNTKFTKHAIDYAACANIRLLGWNYPEQESLQDLIMDFGLHPITCLTSLTNQDKEPLLTHDIVLCKDVLQKKDLLLSAGLKEHRYHALAEEAKQVCAIS